MDGMKEEKEKAVQLALSQIVRQFGEGAIMRLGVEGSALEVAGAVEQRLRQELGLLRPVETGESSG